MPLNKLENFIKNTEGRILYVNPNDLDSTDAIENQGNSLTQPFKTIQRALLEAARFSWVKGNDNDIIEKTTILLYPGDHIVDNRPGFGIKKLSNVAKAVSPAGQESNANSTLSLKPDSNFDLTQEDNILYKFNSVYGGAVVPRGTSLVGLDLRKTKVRPKYVPNPTDDTLGSSAIFRITGGCYFWQFTTFDGDENTTVYTDNKDFTDANQATPTFSHHKLSIFEYADGINNPSGYDLTDLEQYYSKLSNAFNPASGREIDQKYPALPGGFAPKRAEYEIVGAFATDPIGITNIISGNGATPGTVVTVTTTTPHGLNAGTPIKIRGVGVADYNISTVVTDISVSNDKIFTYALPLVRANLPAAPSASGATVTIETDTVSGASPYIFNCSLRSVWGLNGLFADGANATGFRSVVAAQFTGVSLQKDDRAFVKYNPTSRTYNEISTTKVTGSALASGSSSTNADTVYHLDSDAIYKNDWETIHIKATNDAVMQLVSIFAIGYTRHFDVRTGSDYSLTNSNSNFGQLSLVSTGFKKAAFAKDDKAYITSVITPRAIVTAEESLDWQGLDIAKTIQVGFSSHLYLYGYESEDIKPPSLLQGYRVGAKVNDIIYVDDNQSTPVTHSASIKMVDKLPSGGLSNVSYGTNSSFKKYAVTNVASNELTIGSHALITGEKIKVVADDGDLPENLEAHRTYYVIVVNATTIKLASSKTNASTNTPITIYYSGSKLNVLSRVSDKESGDIGHPIQWDSGNSQWYIHVDDGNGIYSTFVSQGVSGFGEDTTKPSYIKRVEDTRSLDEKLYKLRVVVPKEFDNTKNPEEGFIIQESSNTGFRSDTDSALITAAGDQILDREDYDYNRNLRFISNCTEGSSTVTVVSEQPHGLNAWDQIIVKNVTSNGNVTGAGNSGYNGTFKVTGITDDKTFTYSTTDVNGVVHITGGALTNDVTVRDTNLPRFERNDCQDNFYIYRNEVITPYNKDVQDGVYHLYVLNAGNKVGVAFTNVGYSQNVTDLYPQQDKDNPNANPNASKTYASRSPLGEVTTDDLRNSLTRESVDKLLTNFHIGNTITGVTTSFPSDTKGTATLTFARNHNLSGIVTATIASGGSGYTNGTYQNVKLFDNNSSVWDGALARVVVSGGAVTNVDITSGGSGYGAENLDLDLTTTGTAADIVTTITGANAGISTVVGNTVQVTGIGTTAGGHYRITSVPQKNQIVVGISHVDPSINVGQYVINVGHEIKTRSTVFWGTHQTVNTKTAHGLSAGNKVSLIDDNNLNKGDYLVASAGLGTDTFRIYPDSVVSSTYILKHGLSDNDKSSDEDGENLGARGFYFYGNERYSLTDALTTAPTNITVRLSGVDGSTVSRFELGSYIQIDDEIMRITSNKLSGADNDKVFVIRGSLGTLQQAHAQGSLIKKITPKPIEFRRPSIIRASGHTFEYIGYGPGNYSTGLPQVQVKTLTEDEDYLAQAQERDCGTVVYTGMNSKGDFIIGNKKINSATGQEKTFDIPVPTVTGQDPSRLSVVFDEVIIKERLLVEGGNSNTILSEFDGPVNFSQNVKIGGDLTVLGRIKQTNPLTIIDDTQAINKDTGCLILGGGAGIEKNVYVGGLLNVAGVSTFTSSIFPAVDDNVDIGSADKRFQDVYGVNFHGDGANLTNTGAQLGDGGETQQRLVTTDLTTGTMITAATDAGLKWDYSENRLLVADNHKITFGNPDLEIFHNSTNNNSYIKESGTSSLIINTSALHIKNAGDAQTMAKFVSSGAVTLYHGQAGGSETERFRTTSTGAYISGELQVDGEIKAIGSDIIAFASSDENLKDNITIIPNALDKVKAISGNTFTWKDTSTVALPGMDDTGVIAQQVEALGLPGITTTRPDGTKAVRYERLVPILIEAIKELSAKVDALS